MLACSSGICIVCDWLKLVGVSLVIDCIDSVTVTESIQSMV